MPTVTDPAKLADAQVLVGKLMDLPQEALLYIAGYVEGCRDRPQNDKSDTIITAQPPDNRPA